MTKEEFIKSYCDKSQIAEEELKKLGQYAAPCDCKEGNCPGWQMVSDVRNK